MAVIATLFAHINLSFFLHALQAKLKELR